MRYIAVVALEGFYASLAAGRDPSLATGPLVMYGARAVIDANQEARERGVLVGMSLSQARALLTKAHFEPVHRDRYDAAARAWLDILVPFSGDRLLGTPTPISDP